MRGNSFLDLLILYLNSTGEKICTPSGGKAKLEVGTGFKVKNY